jgi:hypothetical protein
MLPSFLQHPMMHNHQRHSGQGADIIGDSTENPSAAQCHVTPTPRRLFPRPQELTRCDFCSLGLCAWNHLIGTQKSFHSNLCQCLNAVLISVIAQLCLHHIASAPCIFAFWLKCWLLTLQKVDLSKLELTALWRYWRHFNLVSTALIPRLRACYQLPMSNYV